ncbi:VWA domain-containing protein [Enemella sp. A6]|uniref:VWA domain-containing protein n=1 Tax=Enemella sp. A6 TaxID=3440152 RepID=UPI003EB861C0
MEIGLTHPDRLLLLLVIPLLVAGYIWASRSKNRRGMRFTNTSVLGRVVPKQGQWRRHLAFAVSLLSLISLTVAFTKPYAPVQVPRERATVVVVLDVSQSMAATDVPPDRLAAAKEAIVKFVEGLPDKYNVALLTLSGNPGQVIPPTTNHASIRTVMQNVGLQDSTAIGEVLYLAVRTLEQVPGDPDNPNAPAPGAIVLLSDGENTAGRSPIQAAHAVEKAGVPVYTIAYGTENGFVDLDGERHRVPPDEKLLQEIASITGGKAYAAGSTSDLSEVYDNIGSEVGYEKVEHEITDRFAGFAIVFAVIAALGALSLAARWN